MATALTTVTTQPIRHDLQVYGGDDVTRSDEGPLGRLVTWEREASSSCCQSAVKACILFFVDKLFAFLDLTGIGGRIYNGGLQETKRVCMEGQMAPERNRVARERIIDAMGGREVCQAIPVVTLPNADLQEHLSVSDEHFPRGQWMIQGEDAAGRKFVALRVRLMEIEIWQGPENRIVHRNLQMTHIITIHQLKRETATDAKCWARNLTINQIVQSNLHYTSDLSDNAREDINICRIIRDLRENGFVSLMDHEDPPDLGPIRLRTFLFERARQF